jgi:hypothetical protein
MSEVEPPRIVAAIEEGEQRDAILAAAGQLSSCMGDALDGDWPLRLRLVGPDDVEVPLGIVLVAWVADRESREPLAETEARWRARIARYQALGHHRILLCTLARQAGAPGAAMEGVERLRRLRRLVIGLSRDLGVEIVDADRLLALCGLRRIAADPRGAAAATAQLVGHAIVDAILQGDMGDGVEAMVQAQASKIHGGVRYIPGVVARRLQEGSQP